jgi:hypothetical protein
MSQDWIEIATSFVQGNHHVKLVSENQTVRVKDRVVAWTSSQKSPFAVVTNRNKI